LSYVPGPTITFRHAGYAVSLGLPRPKMVGRNLSGMQRKLRRPINLQRARKPRWTNAYRALVNPRRWTWGFISRADVADFLVKQIDDDAFLHKTPVLTS